jgi:hypothetical protein
VLTPATVLLAILTGHRFVGAAREWKLMPAAAFAIGKHAR